MLVYTKATAAQLPVLRDRVVWEGRQGMRGEAETGEREASLSLLSLGRMLSPQWASCHLSESA